MNGAAYAILLAHACGSPAFAASTNSLKWLWKVRPFSAAAPARCISFVSAFHSWSAAITSGLPPLHTTPLKAPFVPMKRRPLSPNAYLGCTPFGSGGVWLSFIHVNFTARGHLGVGANVISIFARPGNAATTGSSQMPFTDTGAPQPNASNAGSALWIAMSPIAPVP